MLTYYSAWSLVTEEFNRRTQKNIDRKQLQKKWSDSKGADCKSHIKEFEKNYKEEAYTKELAKYQKNVRKTGGWPPPQSIPILEGDDVTEVTSWPPENHIYNPRFAWLPNNK